MIVELASSRRNPAFEDASNELIFGRPFEAGDRSGIAKFATEKGWKHIAMLTNEEEDYAKGLARYFKDGFNGSGEHGTLFEGF